MGCALAQRREWLRPPERRPHSVLDGTLAQCGRPRARVSGGEIAQTRCADRDAIWRSGRNLFAGSTRRAPPVAVSCAGFLWSLIGAIGAGTVLAYAILPTYFSKEASGRANAALNILHVAVAFGVQGLIGVAIDQWPNVHGRHPAEAYQFAFGANLVVQSLAFGWFLLPSKTRLPARPIRRRIPNLLEPFRAPQPFCPYRAAKQDWLARVAGARAQADGWRTVALTSMTMCVVLLTLVAPKVTFSFSSSQSEMTSDQTIWSTPAMVATGADARMAVTAAHGFAGDTKTGGSDDRPISR